MSKLIGNDKAHPESLEAMLESPYNFKDTRWAAYQNHDLGHSGLGHLKFLAVGPQNTIKESPQGRLPDYHGEINWRYVFVGYVNLETGEIEEA